MNKSKKTNLSSVKLATNKIRENIVERINKKRQFVSPFVFISDLIDVNGYAPIDRFEISIFTESLIE